MSQFIKLKMRGNSEVHTILILLNWIQELRASIQEAKHFLLISDSTALTEMYHSDIVSYRSEIRKYKKLIEENCQLLPFEITYQEVKQYESL